MDLLLFKCTLFVAARVNEYLHSDMFSSPEFFLHAY